MSCLLGIILTTTSKRLIACVYNHRPLWEFRFRRLLQPRGDIGDKLPLSIKCPSRRASQIASDNQSPTPSLLVWLKNKPGGTASTDRRKGEGE